MAQSGNKQKIQTLHKKTVSASMDTSRLSLSQPPPLSLEGDLAKNFKLWIRQVEIYMLANECDKKSSETKAAILLHLLGEEGVDRFDTFDLSESDKKDYEKVLQALKEYCIPKTNETINRHIFFERNQNNENFLEYLSDLKRLAMACNFGNLKDSLIRDKIISGINDEKLRERLLREPHLTLEKCIDMCKAAEIATGYIKQLHSEETKNIDKVFKRKTSYNRKCNRCGYEHPPRQCPAYGKICNYCKKENHFATLCRSRPKDHKIKEVQQDQQEKSDTEEYMLGNINIDDWTIQHIRVILADITSDALTWTLLSPDKCLLECVLLHSGSAMGPQLHLIAPLLKECLATPKVDPEVKLKIFTALSNVLLKRQTNFTNCENDKLEAFLNIVIEEIIMPNLVWSPGRTAEAIRTAAVACLCSALQDNPEEMPAESGGDGDKNTKEVNLFPSSESLSPFLDKIVPLLAGLVDDNSMLTRLHTLRAICCLASLSKQRGCFTPEILHKLYFCQRCMESCRCSLKPHLTFLNSSLTDLSLVD